MSSDQNRKERRLIPAPLFDFEDTPDGDAPPVARAPKKNPPLSSESSSQELPAYLAALNPPQREAALSVEGPLAVLAGAGSGKTRMVTARIAYLTSHLGVSPYNILAVTFTNKAAHELKERVRKSVEAASSGRIVLGEPEVGTFHAVCTRILRREMDKTGFQKPFVIYDDSDQLSLIKSVMRKLNIDTKSFNPKSIQGRINLAKCDALEPHEVPVSSTRAMDRIFKEVYEIYQKELFENNALDFGEILCLAYRVLRDHSDVRAYYQRRFRYIHVDEYQDTNRAQYLLLSLLSQKKHGGHENICIVGDEDQSIYKWRGADIRNILDFESDYPGAKLIKLEQNYRSTQNIILASSGLIAYNSQRKNKKLWTDNAGGSLVHYWHHADERSEADNVVREIRQLQSRGDVRYEDVAVFYRTHAQSRQFEDILRREKIPYQVIGGLKFYDRKEIKDVLAYLRVVQNVSDSVSLKRIINVPARGIGKTTLNRLDQLHFDQDGATLWEILERVSAQHYHLAARSAGKIRNFVEMIQKLIQAQPNLLLSELYHEILDATGYVSDLKKERTVEADARIENLEEFDNLLHEYEDELLRQLPESYSEEQEAQFKRGLLARFLEQITLSTSSDAEVQPSSVKLMTLHAAKGLEFPAVFMVGMEEGLFPSIRAWEETPEEEIEEERRLCYVGMTRAKKKLYMNSANMRRVRGELLFQEPARFLSEIPAQYLFTEQKGGPSGSYAGNYSGASHRHSEKKPSKSWDADYVPDTQEANWIGHRVNHPEYGLGTIVATSGQGEDQKVTVEFGHRVQRKFLLRYLMNLVSK